MAQMHPAHLPAEVTHDARRRAEGRVFAALENTLDDDHHVIYSVGWLSLRGGRQQDGEADFVVLHPERGLLALEVKGGAIGRDGPRWTSRNAKGTVHKIDDPFVQATRCKHTLVKKIKENPRFGTSIWIEARHGVVLPDTQRPATDLGPEAPLEIVAFAEDMEDLGGRIAKIAPGDAHERWRGFDDVDLSTIVSVLHPNQKLELSLIDRHREMDERILELTDRQYAVLGILSRHRRAEITGGAGTGKTALAMEKAARLAGEGFRTLLTCFSRPLADAMSAGLSERVSPDELTVANFHRLCDDLATEAGLVWIAEGEGAPDFGAFPERLSQALELLPGHRFDAIVVDEAQDFDDDWWLPLQLALSDPDDGILYVFADRHQGIYERYRGHDAGGYPSGLASFPLGENLRNAREIHELASRFYAGDPLEPAGPEGGEVEFIEISDLARLEKEVGTALHRLIKDLGVPPKDIAVLTGQRLERSTLGANGRIGAFRVTADQTNDPGAVLLQTIYRFKGLERPCVVLTELEERLGDGPSMPI